MPSGSKFTLFPIYHEDKMLFKYSQVESYMKGNRLYLLYQWFKSYGPKYPFLIKIAHKIGIKKRHSLNFN